MSKYSEKMPVTASKNPRYLLGLFCSIKSPKRKDIKFTMIVEVIH